MPVGLKQRFDAVVMLTASDWFAEMRSNRYHYATRFARHLPVIFVQPDLNELQFRFEESGTAGITVLHVCRHFDWKQDVLLRTALKRKRIVKPLLWVYNHEFLDFIAVCCAPFTIYHATEDYFSPDFRLSSASQGVLRKVLKLSDVLVAVSEGVKDSYRERGRYSGDILVVENGCDFKFWAPPTGEMPTFLPGSTGKQVALYQGGIHRKIDFALMHELVRHLPDWEFWFCGEVYPGIHEWRSLSRHANVRYFGKLRPEEVRELAYRSTVGLIPFVQSDWIIERSFPLKAFEYVACGLPVVSVPIKALQPFSSVVTCAQTPEQFMDAMNRAAPTRHDTEAIAQRLKIARQHDYDMKFEALLCEKAFVAASQKSQRKGSRLLYFRYKAIYLIEGLGRLKRAVGLAVVRLVALAVAGPVKKDPQQLEQELIQFSRRVRGIPVPNVSAPGGCEGRPRAVGEVRSIKLLTVVGARPQFIKAAVVSRAILAFNARTHRDRRIQEVMVHTGQHYDDNMSAIFFQELQIPPPAHHLGVGSGPQGQQTGRMLEGLELVIEEERPDLVLVYGDTNSTLAGSLAASKLRIPVAHVEAGLRSYNRAMPEEVNRMVTDRLSALLFCPTTRAVKNLSCEGIAAGVHLVGDVMYDSLLYNLDQAQRHVRILDSLNLHHQDYALATVHRAETADQPEIVRALFSAFGRLGFLVVVPLHPRTQAVLQRAGLAEFSNGVRVVPPVSYHEMLLLEKHAKLILTDSGGVQKEAFLLRVPCVTLRRETEWVETVEAGWNRLAGTEPDAVVVTARACLEALPPEPGNPYGDGHAAEKILEIIAGSQSGREKAP